MKRVWVARIYPKPRNVLRKGEYTVLEVDNPEELLRELLKIKHRARFELEKVELCRK